MKITESVTIKKWAWGVGLGRGGDRMRGKEEVIATFFRLQLLLFLFKQTNSAKFTFRLVDSLERSWLGEIF